MDTVSVSGEAAPMTDGARYDPEAVVMADILVARGGLLGLTLARALGAAGLRVVVIDREPPAVAAADTFDGRGPAIAWGSSQVLAGLDLWERLAGHAQPIRDIRVSDGQSLLFLHYD